MLLDVLVGVRDTLKSAARDLEPGLYDGPDAAAIMEEVGLIVRYTAAVSGSMSKRVDETQAYVVHGDRSAAEFCARIVGVDPNEAKRAIDNATRLESLPATTAAFREGRLSAQQVSLTSKIAVRDPSLETELLAHAGEGLVPLRDACIAAQARTEDPEARSKRQHAARSLRMWTGDDGMVEGRFSARRKSGVA